MFHHHESVFSVSLPSSPASASPGAPSAKLPHAAAGVPLVLLLTHRQDFYTIDKVAAAVQARGGEALRINTDHFPLDAVIELGFEAGCHRARLHYAGRWIDAAEVCGVWLRHFSPPFLGDGVAPAFRATCEQESRLVMEGFLAALDTARWLNTLPAVERAEAKLRQLRVAQQTGLRIPATLVTNGADEVPGFFARQSTGMVMKLQTALSHSMDGSGPAFYTTVMKARDLEDLSGLKICPPMFQEQIRKQRELRVVYVAGRCFAASLDGEQTGSDWRANAAPELRWQEDALPQAVESRFVAFMQALQLDFGAADFIRTPDGEHVFLEINPCGEWGMLERDLGLPIADAIAAALLGQS